MTETIRTTLCGAYSTTPGYEKPPQASRRYELSAELLQPDNSIIPMKIYDSHLNVAYEVNSDTRFGIKRVNSGERGGQREFARCMPQSSLQWLEISFAKNRTARAGGGGDCNEVA